MRYGIFVSLFLTLVFFSCNKDDNGVETVPPRELSEVAPEDDTDIKEFLQTHFYNYDEFDAPSADFDYKIIIDTIAGANADKKSLMEDAELIKINVSASFLGLEEGEENIEHTLYFIEVRRGGGESPTVADSTLVRYQGSLLNGTLFDESQDYIWQELPSTLRGYANGIAKLRAGTADQIIDNGDGTVSINNSGIGIVVMPSGLAYFNRSPSSLIPSYEPLLFKFELGVFVKDTDTDNDGVPSIQEDLNGNGYLFDDNTDRDEEIRLRTAIYSNFRDGDDDGDGKSTRSEITDENGEIIFPYPDTDKDGVPDYLDPDN